MAVIMEGAVTENALKVQKSLEAGHNRPTINGAWEPRPEQYKVYVFTVSKRPHTVTHALIPLIEIPACDANERYRKVRFIPHPFPQKVEDVFATGREPFDYHSGERVAMDIVNPGNPTLNQAIDDYGQIDPHFAVQDGTNLAQQGVFWSKNETPTEAELVAAEGRVARRARSVIQQFDRLYAENPQTAMQKMNMQEVRLALDHYGEQRPFHKKMTPMTQCPNCAMEMPQSAAFHYLPNGLCCVNDWKKAVDAGVKSKDEVPDAKRWWTKEKAS